MEVLGLLKTDFELATQEEKIKEFCKDKGFTYYITILNKIEELTFVKQHKRIVFSSASVLTKHELEVITSFSNKNNIQLHFAE